LDRLILDRPFFALKDAGAGYELGPPGESELTEIVQKSAEAAGLVYGTDPVTGERLDERILRDAVGGDSLPLLEFTLNGLYERREIIDGETRLTGEAYDRMGGLDGAIDSAAENAIKGFGEDEKAALPRLLSCLAVSVRDKDETATGGLLRTVRVVPITEAVPNDSARRLVDALVGARMLLAFRSKSEEGGRYALEGEKAGESTGAASLRIAHERVLRSWRRAREIIEALGDFFRVRDEVEDQRRKWEESGRAGDFLITARRALDAAEDEVVRYGDLLSPEIREFVAASSRRSRRAQRVKAAAIVAVVAAAVIAIVAATLASIAEEKAQKSYITALSTINKFTNKLLGSLRDASAIINIETINQVLSMANETIGDLQEGHQDDADLNETRASTRYEVAKTYQFSEKWDEAWMAAKKV
jgi:hypothetical protein